MNNVAHFIRKSTQLKASFIQNQILHHLNYTPSIVYKIKTERDDSVFAEFNNKDINILNLDNNPSVFSKLKYKLFKLITQNDKKRIIDFTKNSDILHFHYGTDAGIYLPLLKDIDIPKVVSFYGYESSGFPRRFFGYGKRYLQKRVFRYADTIFAMSPDMKKDLINIGCPEEKILVHYYGTDVNIFSMNHSYFKNHYTINLLIIAGIVPQKGHIFLLKAFRKALEENLDIKLDIVGDGSTRNEMLQYIKQNKMGKYVTWHGPTVYASKEHIEYLQNADVFIHPSVTDVNGDKEGIPGSIIEAMSAGLPVISTYHAGIPFIIEHDKTGLLVNEWDVYSLSKQIKYLVINPSIREKIGKASKEYSIKNLNLLSKEFELEFIYSKIIDK